MVVADDLLQLGQGIFTVARLVTHQAPFGIEIVTDQRCTIGLADTPFRETSGSTFIVFDAVVSNKFDPFFSCLVSDGADPVTFDTGMFLGARHFGVIVGHTPVILAVHHE